MGRKRRLIAASKKFGSKHSAHPIVLRSAEEEPKIEVAPVEEERVVIAKEPEPQELEPTAPQELEPPEPPKPKVRKKRTTRKRTPRKKAAAKEA
jgi:hypothetical protein